MRDMLRALHWRRAMEWRNGNGHGLGGDKLLEPLNSISKVGVTKVCFLILSEKPGGARFEIRDSRTGGKEGGRKKGLLLYVSSSFTHSGLHPWLFSVSLSMGFVSPQMRELCEVF